MVPTYGAGREHRGHRVLIWIAEPLAPLPARRAYRPEGKAYAPDGGQSRSKFHPAVAGSLPCKRLSIWPDFSFPAP